MNPGIDGIGACCSTLVRPHREIAYLTALEELRTIIVQCPLTSEIILVTSRHPFHL